MVKRLLTCVVLLLSFNTLSQIVYVISDDALLRTDKSFSDNNIITKLHKGDKVKRLTMHYSGWSSVSYNNVKGWVLSDMISLKSPTNPSKEQHEGGLSNKSDRHYQFRNGKIVFDCEISCSFKYGNVSSTLKFLYESKDWKELANIVLDIGLAEDESYFYLAAAAKGLGYTKAAKSYYVKSIAATKADMSCGGWPDTCEGFEFPKDAQVALNHIVSNEWHFRQKNNKVQTRVEIEPNNSVSYKDDIYDLLEEWPKVATDENKYLFAVSIDDYDEAPDVSFADRSGSLFVKTMQRLGIPEENSIFLSGSKATGTRILSRLKRVLNQITPEDTLYFYYAGHGLPSRTNDNTYILPVDGDMGSYEDSNMSIDHLYQTMLKSKAKHINVFIDACFSGRADQDTMVFKGVAGLLIKPRAKIDKSRMTVFTAGEGSQFANEYEAKGHRLFSYHLIKGLLEGKTNLRKLAAYVQKNVSKDSRKLGPTYTQEPVIYGSLNHDL